MPHHEWILSNRRIHARNPAAPNPDGRCVVYWMQRAQRGRDNWALNVAIDAGNRLSKPVVTFFALRPNAHHANLRHYRFMAGGLAELAPVLARRGVGWVIGCEPDLGLERFCRQVEPCLVVSDEDPRRGAEVRRQRAADRLPVAFWTVDSDVIVPTRLLGKEHFAARTIRPRILERLSDYLLEVSNPAARIPWTDAKFSRKNAMERFLDSAAIDRTVAPVSDFAGGRQAAQARLGRFLRQGLRGYAQRRNRPEIDGTSRLSPYLHFGQLGPHEVALAIQRADAPLADRDAFLEEFIVRRELAVNFVRYNLDYDRATSAEGWAARSLKQHDADVRSPTYSERQLENAETADPLWNAAQKQMVLSGWMHGYLRMYWAKKILEWSPSPAVAFEIAVRLNDRYQLDGRDPNGYAGIAWAIVGKHDRAWGPERPVYGKIRYMSYASTSRKFDCQAYIHRIAELERRGRGAGDAE